MLEILAPMNKNSMILADGLKKPILKKIKLRKKSPKSRSRNASPIKNYTDNSKQSNYDQGLFLPKQLHMKERISN